MEGGEIGMLLARASELRSKISVCIEGSDGHPRDQAGDACGRTPTEGDADEDGEAESLVGIHGALDSLERQLAALQALQHQQRYKRESTLAQIDRSRMILLSKLKEYRGEELGVIQEVAAFAGEAVDGLVLPPYPTHLPDLFVLDGIGAGSCFVKNKPACSVSVSNSKSEGKGTKCQTDKNEVSKTSNGFKHAIGMVIKSALAFAGLISILSFAGYQPMVKRRPPTEKQNSIRCPQGKFAVIEDGKARCIVKERVEVPFESDITSPSIRYGFG